MALQNEPPLLSTPAVRRRSWLVKFLSIGVLLVLLQVPLVMTHGVLRERQRYQAQAREEISGTWGREQRVIGPVLAVPYSFRAPVERTRILNAQVVTVGETELRSAVAYFFPETLHAEAVIDPEVRHRGIYDVVVHASQLTLSGAFRPDFAGLGVEPVTIDWAKSRVLFGVSDLHGLRSVLPLKQPGGGQAAFEAAVGGPAFLPLQANAGLTAAPGSYPFVLAAVVQGSGSLSLAPVGKTTTVSMRSSWRAPSYTGAWLPRSQRTSEGGFDATWDVAHFSRGFPPAWTSRGGEGELEAKLASAMLGVRLAGGLDGYGLVERAQKYGILFFVLIFAVFVLFEITAGLRIHPLQYAMVGAALCLFFLGFLALTEFWSIAAAYATAAGACTGMVALYAWSFLRTGVRTLVVAGGLAATYAYLYFVLQSEDYALLSGTVALFAVVALAMFLTRRINWYALEAGESKPA